MLNERAEQMLQVEPSIPAPHTPAVHVQVETSFGHAPYVGERTYTHYTHSKCMHVHMRTTAHVHTYTLNALLGSKLWHATPRTHVQSWQLILFAHTTYRLAKIIVTYQYSSKMDRDPYRQHTPVITNPTSIPPPVPRQQ